MNQFLLNEDKRSELLNISKRGDNYAPNNQQYGKNRYERRVLSKVSNSVAEYNAIDMNRFFKEDVLFVNVPVQGETDNYIVTIRMGGTLYHIQHELERNNDILDLKVILRALVNTFNSDDVYIHCSCPDWNFRFSYWSRVNDISSDIDIEQTNNGKRIVNPNDTKGRGCKHTLMVLSNNKWLRKVASVVYNYINYMKNHYQKMYADIIYPAVYGKDYEDEVQLSIEDDDTLNTSSQEIDISNKEARDRGKFKPGNQSGYQFTKTPNKNNKQFNFNSLMSD